MFPMSRCLFQVHKCSLYIELLFSMNSLSPSIILRPNCCFPSLVRLLPTHSISTLHCYLNLFVPLFPLQITNLQSHQCKSLMISSQCVATTNFITPWKSLTPPSLATMRWNDQNIVRAQNHTLVFKFFDQPKKFFKKEKKKNSNLYT